MHLRINLSLLRSVSTHDLTKRSTMSEVYTPTDQAVSTHDLTKRSTSVPAVMLLTASRFNSRPHEEVDRLVQTPCNCSFCFNSRPHEEVDNPLRYPWPCVIVSTHDLTKRSTAFAFIDVLTASGFNSRPHEEVDRVVGAFKSLKSVSTHDLTKRSTTLSTL